MSFWMRWFPKEAPAPLPPPESWSRLLEEPRLEGMSWIGRRQGREARMTRTTGVVLELACRADLWCRPRTSVSSLLDPTLFERYNTEVDAIDDEWIVQSNPPCAFKKDFVEGCEALLQLLKRKTGIHATRGFLHVQLTGTPEPVELETVFRWMEQIVRTAEREMTPIGAARRPV